MMSIAIYTLLLFLYIPALFVYPRETLLATILFCIFFLLFKMWLKSKSRYIVSTSLFLLGVAFFFGGIGLVYSIIKEHGSLRGVDGPLGFMILMGIMFLFGNINKKQAGEQEVHTISDLSALLADRKFQQVVLQDDFDTWVHCATAGGPLFRISDNSFGLKHAKINTWLEYVPRQKEILFQATKRVVELAEEKQLTQIGSYHIRDYYNQLGWMYEEGFGCPINLPQAVVYYQKALPYATKMPLIMFKSDLRFFNTAKALKRVQKKLSH